MLTNALLAAPGDRRPRRRSRSPQNIDRYQPDRARDYDHPRRDGGRRRSSPPPVQAGIDRYVPGQDSFAPTFTTNPIPNPMSLSRAVCIRPCRMLHQPIKFFIVMTGLTSKSHSPIKLIFMLMPVFCPAKDINNTLERILWAVYVEYDMK